MRDFEEENNKGNDSCFEEDGKMNVDCSFNDTNVVAAAEEENSQATAKWCTKTVKLTRL